MFENLAPFELVLRSIEQTDPDVADHIYNINLSTDGRLLTTINYVGVNLFADTKEIYEQYVDVFELKEDSLEQIQKIKLPQTHEKKFSISHSHFNRSADTLLIFALQMPTRQSFVFIYEFKQGLYCQTDAIELKAIEPKGYYFIGLHDYEFDHFSIFVNYHDQKYSLACLVKQDPDKKIWYETKEGIQEAKTELGPHEYLFDGFYNQTGYYIKDSLKSPELTVIQNFDKQTKQYDIVQVIKPCEIDDRSYISDKHVIKKYNIYGSLGSMTLFCSYIRGDDHRGYIEIYQYDHKTKMFEWFQKLNNPWIYHPSDYEKYLFGSVIASDWYGRVLVVVSQYKQILVYRRAS